MLRIYVKRNIVNKCKNKEIYMKRGAEPIITKLLAYDKEMEKLPRQKLLAKYSEALLVVLLFTLS